MANFLQYTELSGFDVLGSIQKILLLLNLTPPKEEDFTLTSVPGPGKVLHQLKCDLASISVVVNSKTGRIVRIGVSKNNQRHKSIYLDIINENICSDLKEKLIDYWYNRSHANDDL